MNLSQRPLVWFAVCWTAGGATAAALDTRGVLLAGGALAAALLALALARQAPAAIAAACLAAYALAAGERAWADAHNVSALAGLYAAADADRPPQVLAAGVIASAVDLDGDRVRFTLTADSVAVKGEPAPRRLRERLLVTVRLASEPDLTVAARWQRGDRIRLAGELSRPAPATNFGGFDYRRYLYSQRIHWLLQAEGAGAVAHEGNERWSAAAFLRLIDGVRSRLGAGMDRLYPHDQSGYMKGLVLGLTDDMDPERYRQFSGLGLTHILAISGLHVAVFLYVLSGLLRMMRLTRERVIGLLIAAVPFYVLLAGASPSVIRAGIMAMIALLAARLHKLKDGLHLLCAASIIMLAWDPYLIGSVSFQLSFIVTAGLIAGVMPFRGLLPQGGRLRWGYDLAAVTIVAQAVSFPLTIYYFDQFNLLSLPANFVLVPFISFAVMPLGAASLLVSAAWHPAGALLSSVTGAANEATFGLIGWLDTVERVRSIWAPPPLWWICAWYAALLLAFRIMSATGAGKEPEKPAAAGSDDTTQPLADAPVLVNPYVLNSAPRKSGGWLLLPALAIAALLVYAYQPDRFDRSAVVELLDVGQGDAIHIRTPSGRHMLIDGGGTLSFRKKEEAWRQRRDPFEVGRKIVVPLLMKRGVHVIDTLVITHLDSDHIGGISAVIEAIPVRRVLWNGTLKPSRDAESLLRQIVDSNIPIYRAAGIRDPFPADDDTELRVLWPGNRQSADGSFPIRPIQNDESVVLWLKLYNTRLLLTGDITAAAESEIIRKLDADGGNGGLLPLDILKVCHHGSKTCTSDRWLRYWQPSEAAVSVGRRNTYGHPNSGVLQRIASYGGKVRRTDTSGGIQYRITRDGLTVRAKL